MRMSNLPKKLGLPGPNLVKTIFLDSAGDADSKNVFVKKFLIQKYFGDFWVTFLGNSTLQNLYRTLTRRPNVQEYMRKIFPKSQNMRKICANMRKYAHFAENPKYAQKLRKYAQICAAHVFPSCYFQKKA